MGIGRNKDGKVGSFMPDIRAEYVVSPIGRTISAIHQPVSSWTYFGPSAGSRRRFSITIISILAR
jgi:hypothetical protein